MKAQLINNNQIRAFISQQEVAQRSIDLETATYHDPAVFTLINDVLLTLKDQVAEHIFKMPHRTEIIPMADGSLILLITWSAEEREYLNDKSNTFTPPPELPGNLYAAEKESSDLPLDELQSSVISDILSALGTGNLKEHLKKYLNENFLEELISAVSASGLEDIISSFLADEAEGTGEMPGSEEFDAEAASKSVKAIVSTKQKECVCFTFKTLSEAEKMIAVSGLNSFKGESILFKVGNKYLLVLSPGKMPDKKFDEATKSLITLYNGELRPLTYIAYLSEHEKTVIGKDAVKTLRR